MLEKLQERREELKAELTSGTMRLRELEKQAQSLRETMGRISGAIQVLDELIDEAKSNPDSME